MKRWLIAAICLFFAGEVYADTDNFNRPGPALGNNWNAITTGQFEIINNEVRVTQLFGGIEAVYAPVNGTDQTAQVTITAFTGASYGDVGPMVRATPDPGVRENYNCVAVRNDTIRNSTTQLIVRTPGAGSVVAEEFVTTWVAGDIIALNVTGDTLTCYRNGASLLNYSPDSTYASGHSGMRMRNNNTFNDIILDDFFTTLSAPGGGAIQTMVITVP